MLLPIQNDAKNLKNDRNPGTWYSSESTQWVLSNEYHHDGVQMVFKSLCVIVLWMKVAVEGLNARIAKQTLIYHALICMHTKNR